MKEAPAPAEQLFLHCRKLSLENSGFNHPPLKRWAIGAADGADLERVVAAVTEGLASSNALNGVSALRVLFTQKATRRRRAVAAKTTGILKLRELIPWESFRPLLEELTGYVTRDWRKGGNPPFDSVLMFKVLVLQKFHGLSDDATEEQMIDHTSFKSFLGLCIGDVIPDAKTIWGFKQRLEAEGREG